MKRSEIYLKAAKLVKKEKTYGCFAIQRVQGKYAYNLLEDELEYFYPEFALFKPDEKQQRVIDKMLDTSGFFGGDYKHREIAFLFAHEIAKSNGN